MRAIALFTVALAACGRGSSMDGLLEVRNITVSIQRPPRDVYAFITNGDNVPRWAAGLGTGCGGSTASGGLACAHGVYGGHSP